MKDVLLRSVVTTDIIYGDQERSEFEREEFYPKYGDPIVTTTYGVYNKDGKPKQWKTEFRGVVAKDVYNHYDENGYLVSSDHKDGSVDNYLRDRQGRLVYFYTSKDGKDSNIEKFIYLDQPDGGQAVIYLSDDDNEIIINNAKGDMVENWHMGGHRKSEYIYDDKDRLVRAEMVEYTPSDIVPLIREIEYHGDTDDIKQETVTYTNHFKRIREYDEKGIKISDKVYDKNLALFRYSDIFIDRDDQDRVVKFTEKKYSVEIVTEKDIQNSEEEEEWDWKE